MVAFIRLNRQLNVRREEECWPAGASDSEKFTSLALYSQGIWGIKEHQLIEPPARYQSPTLVVWSVPV